MDLRTPTLGSDVHPAYDNPRPEVAALVPPGATRVLDLGCSTGRLGLGLVERGHHVVGIEYDPELVTVARTRLAAVTQGDLEAMAAAGTDPGGPFDCIIAADVLEHLRDPWSVVRWAAGLLDANGVMVVSVPNVRHIETFWSLIRHRRWPYKSVGIFDRTHLRWFARANLPDLFEGSGLRIRSVGRVSMLSLDINSKWNRLAPHVGDWGTLQFLIVAGR